jgi:hypothetical protein
LLQNLINMANAQLARTGAAAAPIVIDGRLDKRTLAAYMPVSRGIGGTLAIFDFSPDPKYLATNVLAFAQTIAQWLNITWVEATALTAGHWERLRVGQTSVLPAPPMAAPAPTSLCPPGTVATSRGCLPSAPPQPDQPPPPLDQTLPTALPPPTVMTMYVCPDGTRVSSMDACLKQRAQPAQCLPPPSPSPGSQVSPSYWDSYNACLERQGLKPVQVPPHTYGLEPPPGTLPFPGTITPPASKRYAGCLARFNKTRKVFAIYCPIGTAPTTVSPGLAAYSGFRGYDDEQFRCLYGNCGGLGADTVTPPVPANFIKTAETRALPGEGETPAGEEKDKFFRANNPAMWALFMGTAAVIGGGSYFIVRHRRRAA